MRRFLYDTNVFVYAVGGPSPYRDACRAIVERAAAGELAGEASVGLLQEFAHQRLRRTGDRRLAVAAARRVAPLCALHDVTAADVTLGLALLGQHDALSARDATFAAVALNRGVEAILTADTAFDGVGALQRVDPRDRTAVDALA